MKLDKNEIIHATAQSTVQVWKEVIRNKTECTMLDAVHYAVKELKNDKNT